MDKKVKILIVKLSSLGDLVQTFALVNHLQAKLPKAKIDWAVNHIYADLVAEAIPRGKLHRFKRKEWGSRFWQPSAWLEMVQFISGIRAEKYDYVLDLQGLARSGIITLLSGGKEKVGLEGSREGSKHCYNRIMPVDGEQDAMAKLFKVCSLFGLEPPEAEDFGFPLRLGLKKRAATILQEAGVDGKYMVCHATARWETKLYGVENWAVLAGMMREKYGYQILFTGSATESGYIDSILHLLPEVGFFNICGRGSLPELAAILASAEVVVTLDSGPMHLAAAFNRPMVALFGPTDHKKTAPHSSAHTTIIMRDIDCVPCLKRKCARKHECMEEIIPEEIFFAVEQILGK